MGSISFAVGAIALAVLSWRGARVWRVQGIAALGVGILVAFAALSLTATLLSAFQRLTGPAWSACLAVAAGSLFLFKAPPAFESTQFFTARQLLVLLIPAALVGYAQLAFAIFKYDDFMYHASRAGYWLVQHSVFPFASHNDRQTVFPYAGNLVFAFGVFTARSEMLGRMLVFLAYPAMLVMIARMLRQLGVDARIAIGAAWVIGATPLVRNCALGATPDAWGWVFMLLAVNAVWSFLEPAPADTMRMKQAIVLFGALCAAVAVKFTFLILLPLGLICLTARMRLAQWGLAALTVPLWAVCFGLVVTLPYNRFETGGWFGPASMTEAHERDPSASAAIRQVARLPFVTLGVPFIPTEGLRQITETAVRVTADRLHVTEPLAWEMPTLEWPGLFTPTVTRFDYRFSWLGLFIATAAVAWLAKRKTLAVHTGVPLAMATLLIGVAFVLAVTITIRWQTHSMVPERLIVPGMVTAAVGAAAILYFVLGRLRYGIAVMLAMAGFHALPFLNWTRVSFLQSPQELVAQRQWYPLGVAAGSVKPGSRVLLFATQDAADYLLFHPDLGFPTEVHPWGKQPFSPTALASALDEIQPDTIVFERPDRLRFNWHPERANDIAVAPFTDYLDNHTSFRREPVAGLSLIYTRRIE